MRKRVGPWGGKLTPLRPKYIAGIVCPKCGGKYASVGAGKYKGIGVFACRLSACWKGDE